MQKKQINIKAKFINLAAGGFKTTKDQELFEEMSNGIFGWNDGVVFNPIYSDEGGANEYHYRLRKS